MACCGGKRQEIKQEFASGAVKARPGAALPPRAAVEYVFFKYVGRTGLTVVGPITGRRYRFGAPGAVMAVDSRDAPGVSAAPNLQRVAKMKEYSNP